MSCPAYGASGPFCPQPVILPYTIAGLTSKQRSGPKPKRSMVPGRKPSISASAFSISSNTRETATGSFRSRLITCLLRNSVLYFNGLGIPSTSGCFRSILNTVAPRSARIMAHIGPGPMPENSMIFKPDSGPDMFASMTFATFSNSCMHDFYC